MKKIMFLFVLTLSFTSVGQSLLKDEVDDFTKKEIKETEWEVFTRYFHSYIRFRKVDSEFLMDFKMWRANGSVFSVNEGETLYFKFTDGEVMKIQNSNYEITGYGDGATNISGSGALGIYLKCNISKDQLEILSTKEINQLRIYTSNGYIENDVKPKFAEEVQNLANLILKS